MPEEPDNIVYVARAMMAAFGARAARVMDGRVDHHLTAGDLEGAEFWQRVADAIRDMETTRS